MKTIEVSSFEIINASFVFDREKEGKISLGLEVVRQLSSDQTEIPSGIERYLIVVSRRADKDGRLYFNVSDLLVRWDYPLPKNGCWVVDPDSPTVTPLGYHVLTPDVKDAVETYIRHCTGMLDSWYFRAMLSRLEVGFSAISWSVASTKR